MKDLLECLECKVIRLDQPKGNRDFGIINKALDTLLLYDKTTCLNFGAFIPQHLYLVSDREIKEGDYIFTSYKDVLKTKDRHLWIKGEPKVEAATDSSLALPHIPQSFIEEYVQKQGKIDKVRIQLYHRKGKELVSTPYNEVIILPPIRDSWNREEVKEIAKTAYISFAGLPSEFDKWFDENY